MGQIKQLCRECGSKGIVQKTERPHIEFSKIYFLCSNPECSHSWASNLIFSHTIKESKTGKNGLVAFLVDKLPLDDLNQLKNAIVQKQLDLGLEP